jgi:hypothetical protein
MRNHEFGSILASIVHFSYIDQLFTPTTGNILRVLLRQQSLIRCLDSVHGVPRPRDPSGKIVNASAVGHFPDQ